MYHEKYDCVAVMFASIPKYAEIIYVKNKLNFNSFICIKALKSFMFNQM